MRTILVSFREEELAMLLEALNDREHNLKKIRNSEHDNPYDRLRLDTTITLETRLIKKYQKIC